MLPLTSSCRLDVSYSASASRSVSIASVALSRSDRMPALAEALSWSHTLLQSASIFCSPPAPLSVGLGRSEPGGSCIASLLPPLRAACLMITSASLQALRY